MANWPPLTLVGAKCAFCGQWCSVYEDPPNRANVFFYRLVKHNFPPASHWAGACPRSNAVVPIGDLRLLAVSEEKAHG